MGRETAMGSWRQVGSLVGLVLSFVMFSQPDPGFSISPRSGRQGSEVTVTGTVPGADPQKVIVRWDGVVVATCEAAPGACPGDPPRGFAVGFRVPDGAAPGAHKVELCLRYCDPVTTAWPFVVEPDPPLEITGVDPEQTAPGRPVTVSGHTGECAVAALVLGTPVPVGQQVDGDAAGSFTATVTVPKGIPPATYRLELRSNCRRVAVTQDEHPLEVVNHAPQPADDTATTGSARRSTSRSGSTTSTPTATTATRRSSPPSPRRPTERCSPSRTGPSATSPARASPAWTGSSTRPATSWTRAGGSTAASPP
jgi:hypothetical protein